MGPTANYKSKVNNSGVMGSKFGMGSGCSQGYSKFVESEKKKEFLQIQSVNIARWIISYSEKTIKI